MTSQWMLYSHDALGLGHVRRMLAIAGSVLPHRPDLSALLVTCSPQIDALPVPAGLDYIKLPSARKLGSQQYVARSLRLVPDRLRELRAALLADTARTYAPDVLLVDKSPSGLMGELLPALETLEREKPSARTVLGWRDILDAPRLVSEEWARKGTLEAIERWYDEIWVYGDPEVFDARVEYDMPSRVAERVRFLGYLAPHVDTAARERARRSVPGEGPLALVTVGGGEDGESLLTHWMEAAHRGLLPEGVRSLVVTGPMMPADAQRRIAGMAHEGVTVVPFVKGLEAMIAAADVVVGMAGYNTVCEALGAGTPLVLSPRSSQREEQMLRARRLAARGLARCIEPEALSAAALASAASEALGQGRMPGVDRSPSLDGLARAASALERLLPGPNGNGASPVPAAPAAASRIQGLRGRSIA